MLTSFATNCLIRVFLTCFFRLQVLMIFLNILRQMLRLHLLSLRAEMNHTPGSSPSVGRKQSTSTSLPTSYWGKKEMNTALQVGNLIKTLHRVFKTFKRVATSNSILRLNKETLEQKFLDPNPGLFISCVVLNN